MHQSAVDVHVGGNWLAGALVDDGFAGEGEDGRGGRGGLPSVRCQVK
jgi:hypothetical protein